MKGGGVTRVVELERLAPTVYLSQNEQSNLFHMLNLSSQVILAVERLHKQQNCRTVGVKPLPWLHKLHHSRPE